MKTILIVLLSLVVLSVNAKDKPELVGFLITTKTFETGFECHKEIYLDIAEQFLNKNFPEINLKQILNVNNYLEIKSKTKFFYIERKRLILKRNGEYKFKTIRQKNYEKYYGKY